MKSIAKRSGIWFGLMGMMVFVLCLGLTVLPASAKKIIKIGHIDPDDPFLSPGSGSLRRFQEHDREWDQRWN